MDPFADRSSNYSIFYTGFQSRVDTFQIINNTDKHISVFSGLSGSYKSEFQMQVPPQTSAFESVTDNPNSKFWTTIESFGIITIEGKVAKVNEMRDVQVIEFGISNTPVGIVTKPVSTYIIYHLNDLHLRYVDDAKMFCFHGEMYFVQGVVDEEAQMAPYTVFLSKTLIRKS